MANHSQRRPRRPLWPHVWVYIGTQAFATIAVAMHVNIEYVLAISGAQTTMFTTWWICTNDRE
jgi:hypothetical protein